MKVHKEDIEKMEAQLLQWEAKLDELIAKAAVARAEAKSDYVERIDELKAKHRSAKAKLNELKTSGNEKWEILKAGFEGAWNELEEAFKKIKD